MPRTHDEAFLEDIVTTPDDDAPRLIYADWLDDHGDSDRAEFIRVQVELRRPVSDQSRLKMLLARQQLLWQQHKQQWHSTLPALPGVHWQEPFSGGFVEAVFVHSVDLLLRHAEEIFAAAPIRRLQLGHIDAIDASNLARCPRLSGLTELNLGNNPGLEVDGLSVLARSPYLGNLKALLLHNNALGDDAMEELVASSSLGGLTELYLSGNDLGDAGVRLLAGGRDWPALTELDLRDNRFGDSGAAALGRSTGLPALTTLYLVNNQIHTFGAATIAWSETLPRLAQLYLNHNPLGNDGAIAFALTNARSALRDLDLRDANIRDTGARALARSESLLGLDLLWLSGNALHRETNALLRGRYGTRLRI